MSTATVAYIEPRDVTRKDITIAAMIILGGALLGLVVQIFYNESRKISGCPAVESDISSALRGAIFGALAALIVVGIMIFYFRGQERERKEAAVIVKTAPAVPSAIIKKLPTP